MPASERGSPFALDIIIIIIHPQQRNVQEGELNFLLCHTYLQSF